MSPIPTEKREAVFSLADQFRDLAGRSGLSLPLIQAALQVCQALIPLTEGPHDSLQPALFDWVTGKPQEAA